ncbi:glycosyltransferase family 1 protein [candidate division KSB1 bacterium]|nr:glycosyltransferase family 1 protein [candidate division KSB1 bacterium]
MKVAYFTESLPPQTDGVARTLVNLIQTLETNHIEFRFISPFKPSNSIPWSDKVYKVSSVPFILYRDYRFSLPLLDRLELEDVLDSFAPDIIHTVSPTALGVMGLNYAIHNNIPAVSSYHTHFVSYFKYYGLSLVESVGWNYLRWFYNQFNRVFVPSKSTADELSQKGFENIELWQRGIDMSRFSPTYRSDALRESLGASTDDCILLFVGRLVKEKDLDDLVEMDKILKQDGVQYKLVLVGDGPMREELEENLPEAHFTGYLHNEDLSRLFASSDIFVFPSTTETFGNVILEAYASGIPVVSVDKGGVADLIKHGETGFIAKSNNPADFAKHVRTILTDAEKRRLLGANAKRYSAEFNWDYINKKLIQSYQETIDQYTEHE